MAGSRFIAGRPIGRLALCATTVAFALASGGTAEAASGHSKDSLTVVEEFGGQWNGLAPATSTANAQQMDPVYGDLFELGPNHRIVPDLATGYQLTNGGKTLVLHIREGVSFTDGTPFNAAAVAYNFRRDLDPKNACTCLPNFPVTSVTTPDNYTVDLNLSHVDNAIAYAIIGEAPNWVASPTAINKEGIKQFALTPVGAGPYEVAKDDPNSQLVLKANPDYWQKGRPFIKNLTFTTVGADQSAYDALLSGQAQAYQDVTTYPLLATAAKAGLTVTGTPASVGTFVVQMNTTVAPFNNIKAREAIYYATDAGPINKQLTSGRGTLMESPTQPGGLFYEPRVPGYRQYDLAKAKALVKQLGGLDISLETGTQAIDVTIETVLKSQWAQAGIQATISSQPLETVVNDFKVNKWQAFLQQAGGGFDPALGSGLPFRYESTAPFTGVHDPTLDRLITQGLEELNPSAQTNIYKEIFRRISDQAYSPFLFVTPNFNLSVKGVSGPGLTTPLYAIEWQNVKYN